MRELRGRMVGYSCDLKQKRELPVSGTFPWILREISLSVEKKGQVGLVGPSGYSKGTLLLMEISQACFRRNPAGRSRCPKGRLPVQLIYQHPEKAINPRWKMKKVLEESGMFRREIMEALGIEEEWLSRYPRELSGGELQRFCVARSLFEGTQFLLADEMSTMLDVIAGADLEPGAERGGTAAAGPADGHP